MKRISRWRDVGWGALATVAYMLIILSQSFLVAYGPFPEFDWDYYSFDASPLWYLGICCVAYSLVFFVACTRFTFAKLESDPSVSWPESSEVIEFGPVRRVVRFPGAWFVGSFAAVHFSLFAIGVVIAGETDFSDPVERNFLLLHGLTMIVALWLVFVLVAHASLVLSRWMPGKPVPRRTIVVLALVAPVFVLASQSLTIAFIDDMIDNVWWFPGGMITGFLSLLENDINAQSALHYIFFALVAGAALFVIQWILGENVPEMWRRDDSTSDSS